MSTANTAAAGYRKQLEEQLAAARLLVATCERALEKDPQNKAQIWQKHWFDLDVWYFEARLEMLDAVRVEEDEPLGLPLSTLVM